MSLWVPCLDCHSVEQALGFFFLVPSVANRNLRTRPFQLDTFLDSSGSLGAKVPLFWHLLGSLPGFSSIGAAKEDKVSEIEAEWLITARSAGDGTRPFMRSILDALECSCGRHLAQANITHLIKKPLSSPFDTWLGLWLCRCRPSRFSKAATLGIPRRHGMKMS